VPLLALQVDLTGPRRQRPAWQRLIRLGTLAGWSAATGTARGLLLVGSSGGVGVDVLLQEPGDEVVAQQAGAVLALAEGDQGILLGVGEEPVESVTGTLEKLLTQLLTALRVHGSTSGDAVNGRS
jgi:hypothetical protein